VAGGIEPPCAWLIV